MSAMVNDTSVVPDPAWLLTLEGPMACVSLTKSSGGIWAGESPLRNVFSLYLLQFILVNLITQGLYYVLRPLRQTKLVCYFLAGIILSHNVLGQSKIFGDMVFRNEHMMLARTVGTLGIMYFLFLLAVKIDLGPIQRTMGEATLITISSEAATYLAVFALSFMFELRGIQKGFFHALMAAGLSLTRFSNVAQAFNELNILSSELGSLAVSCTIIYEFMTWWWLLIGQYLRFPSQMGNIIICIVAILMIFYLVIRPGIWSIIRRTPDGRPVKEGYILLILVGSLVLGFVSDMVSTMQMGLFIFGLLIPSGPPLGSTLADKAEVFVSELLLPMYYVAVGYTIDITLLESNTALEIFAVVMLSALAKLAATVFSGCFMCDIPLRHSLLLGLMMNIRGPFDIFLLHRWLANHSIDRRALTAFALSDILLTAMVTPWIDIFYNPHARLSASTLKNTTFFLNAPRNVELSVLCCIETEENVPSIISLLEVMNPTQASPICAYIVHLNELVGLATPAMIPYNANSRQAASKRSSSIVRAFDNYSRNSLGLVTVRPYTVLATHKSMHEYICRLALKEFIPLVIIPYQANPQSNAIEATTLRIINSNVQTYSPCTIGVLVNKGIARFSQTNGSSLSVAVLFVSGNDDREALAFGIRITGNPNVRVSLIRIVTGRQEDMSVEKKAEKKLDDSLISKFLEENGSKKVADYHEIVAEDAVEVMEKIRGLDVGYDLIVLGRKRKSSLLAEDIMQDWSENPELGVLGDLFASADHYAATSVLVMQHTGDISADVQSNSNEGEGQHLLRTD